MQALEWASAREQVRFAVENCRHVTGRLEGDLPAARLDGPEREVKLLSGYRHNLAPAFP